MDYFYENRFHLLDDRTPLSIYRNEDFSFRNHWHTEVEIIFVEVGSLVVSVNNDRRKLVSGEFVICRSGDIHYVESSVEGSKIMLLVFKPEYFGFTGNLHESITFLSPFVTRGTLTKDQVKVIYDLLLTIYIEKTNKELHYTSMVKSKVIELCVYIMRTIPTKKASSMNNDSLFATIHKVLEYIETNYAEPLSLVGLAQEFNVDSYNLSKTFNKMTGSNLKTYINMLRVSKAEELILNSDKTLMEIAMESGYGSIRTFNRRFKLLIGVTPSELRKRKNNE